MYSHRIRAILSRSIGPIVETQSKTILGWSGAGSNGNGRNKLVMQWKDEGR